MLQSVYIENLFGLYTYNLMMESNENDTIRFVTGPNGYGKTTILNALDCLYNGNFKGLSHIAFDILRLDFDNDIAVNVKQTRYYENQDNVDSDEQNFSKVILDVEFKSEGKNLSSVRWDSSKGKLRIKNEPALLYLSSHPIYYIKDKRLKKNKGITTVLANADEMREKLKSLSANIGRALQVSLNSSEDSISETEYNATKERIKDDLDVITFCGLLDKDVLPIYDIEKAGYLKFMSETLSSQIKANKEFIDRVKCFRSIIESCELADKRLQLSPDYGYRFVLDNADKTILFSDSLSSGEQHTLIVFYELLFKVPDASLVLIDEPEISLHVMWQMLFLKNLRKITSLRKNMQCIVCTHSPEIFDMNFDKTVDLYSQMHPSV